MSISINNTSFIITEGSIFLSNLPYTGQIFRAAHVGVGTDGLVYTKPDGTEGSITMFFGDIKYILVKPNTLSDTPSGGVLGQLAITNLLISSDRDPDSSFTEQLITTTGAGTWTKPAGVTQVIVECWGGGGAGGGVTLNPAGGGGGGGGQYARKYIQYSSPSVGISYSVAASTAGTTGNGSNGGDTTWATNVVIAKGGTGGQAEGTTTPAAGGVGNQAGSIGDVIYYGGDGEQGDTLIGPPIGGGGGGAAGSTSGGGATQEYGGFGGSQLFDAASTGNPGSNYGGGGGGASANSATNQNGGTGAQGLIRIIYR